MSTKLFDSLAGMIHYFVRPEDDFVLNSLEKINSDEYLYRLLKKCGYERIVFWEREEKIRCFAFDEVSHFSITKSELFEKVDMSDEHSVQQFVQEARQMEERSNANLDRLARGSHGSRHSRREATTVPVYGKEYINLNSEASRAFFAHFLSNIVPAMKATNAKTAIVMQIDLFDDLTDEYGNISREMLARISGTVGGLFKNNEEQKNIMVFTAKQMSDITKAIKNKLLHNLHANLQYTDEEKFVETLRGCMVLANAIGIDEIANLLLRKKLLEPQILRDIPYSKIYGLAKLLRNQLMGNEILFSTINHINFEDSYIRKLNGAFEQNEGFVEELIMKSKGVQEDILMDVRDKEAIMVERVTREYARYVKCRPEDELIAEFDNLIGENMDTIKQQVLEAVNYYERKRKEAVIAKQKGEKQEMPYMNMLFLGPPGTGKTTVAKIVAQLFYAKGILPTDNIRVVNASGLVSDRVGGTKTNIEAEVEKAIGGVLVLDEFYGFDEPHSTGNGAKEAMDAILNAINMYKDKLCIIAIGYEDQVKKVLSYNEGGDRRFPIKIYFENYSLDDLMMVMKYKMEKMERTFAEGVEEKVRIIVDSEMRMKADEFGNVGGIENILQQLDTKYIARNATDGIYTLDDIYRAFDDKKSLLEKDNKSIETILANMDQLKGEEIQKVKDEVLEQIDYFEWARINNPKIGDEMPYMNMRFVGSPGTGKTTIAKLVAELFYAKGILPSNRVKCVRAGELVAGTVGKTAENIREKAKEANGGVLIIDEFPQFKQGYTGGNTAEQAMGAVLDVIDQYRDTLCIIAAGYEKEVEEVLKFNDGLDRRFSLKVHFEDYSVESLLNILLSKLQKIGVNIEQNVEEKLALIIDSDKKQKGKQFGNAGYINQVYEELIKKIISRKRECNLITVEDIIKTFPNKAHLFADTPKEELLPMPDRTYFESMKVPYTLPEKIDKETLISATDTAVLFIQTDRGCGTGFLISPDGYAITCTHVINGAKNIRARIRIPDRQGAPDQYFDCKVVKAEKDLDIAVIHLENSSNCPYLKLASQERIIKKGEDFILSGYPFGNSTKDSLSTNKGSVSSGEGLVDAKGIGIYNIECEAKRGNSGSPIISLEDGCVIGILIGSSTSTCGKLTEEINRFRPIKYFWEAFF